jgi:hypothetical protein
MTAMASYIGTLSTPSPGRSSESPLLGNSHDGFGGRPCGKGPAQAGTSPHGRPCAKRGRTTLTPGWRLLRLPHAHGRRPGSEVCVTRPGGWDRPTAILVFAGRSRACQQCAGRCPRLATLRAPGGPPQRPNGGLSCHGGAGARHEDLAARLPLPEPAKWKGITQATISV